MTPNLRGASLMVLAMTLFALEDACFKAVTKTTPPGIGTMIFGLGGLIVFALWTRAAGERVWTPAYLSPVMLVRSGFEIMGRLFFALALAFAPLATTSAILQAATLVVTLGAALFLGERVGLRRWIAMAVGFAGVVLILRPGAEAFEPTLIFAVLGMIGFSGRDLATRASPPSLSLRQLGVPGFAVVLVAGLIIATVQGDWRLPDATAALLLCGTILAGVCAYTALSGAMRSGDVSVVAPFRYSRLLVALVLAVLLFDERPDTLALIGATLIVTSGLYTLLRSRAGARRGSGVSRRP
ncbi:DMT family transporter [Palleronia caenipelagi]|uniref:DMT family transporter n=1 Tax=Palleronia caenipelagi TaxID=2489174 RepID=A0A547Q7C2_9RHOB|nr:DMT family transporter [Palleronia caenipelagi]TRD22274.1 DMT family transporter [Palleronia caenipelagi]